MNIEKINEICIEIYGKLAGDFEYRFVEAIEQAARATAEQSKPMGYMDEMDLTRLREGLDVVMYPTSDDSTDIALYSRSRGNSLPHEWISVDERLPEPNSVVLVIGWAYNKPDGERFTVLARHFDGKFLNEETGDDLHPPTHWQPLPTPPADAAIESQRSGDGS